MHDKNGKLITIGDVVTLEVEVTSTQPNPDYCNVTGKYVEPFWPDANRHDSVTFNSKMCTVTKRTQNVQSEEHISQFFAYAHLPPHLQAVSAPFVDLAAKVLELPRNPERTVALRKLLEAKDAAVRALLAK